MSLESVNEQLAEVTGGTGTLSDTLAKLSSDISNAYDAIEDKGGTIPEDKNTDSLPGAINTITGGGGDDPAPAASQYGTARFYAFEYGIGQVSRMGGGMMGEVPALVAVDQAKAAQYCADNGIVLDFDMMTHQPIMISGSSNSISFQYDDWEAGISIQETYASVAALEEATGIRIAPSSSGNINVEIGKVVILRKSRATTDVVLSDASQLANFSGEFYGPMGGGNGEVFYTVNGNEYPACALKAFYFGTAQCNLPNSNFMGGAINLETISQFPTWLTSLPAGSFDYCYSLKKIELPSTGNVTVPNSRVMFDLFSLEEIAVGESAPFTSAPSGYPTGGYYVDDVYYLPHGYTAYPDRPITITGANRAAWVTAWGNVYNQNSYYRYIVAGAA